MLLGHPGMGSEGAHTTLVDVRGRSLGNSATPRRWRSRPIHLLGPNATVESIFGVPLSGGSEQREKTPRRSNSALATRRKILSSSVVSRKRLRAVGPPGDLVKVLEVVVVVSAIP